MGEEYFYMKLKVRVLNYRTSFPAPEGGPIICPEFVRPCRKVICIYRLLLEGLFGEAGVLLGPKRI